MKKTIYALKSYGENGYVELEILLDINRELTKIDSRNIRVCADTFMKSLYKESRNLDPKVKIEAEEEKSQIIALFGTQSIFVEEIPNEYDEDSFPWFIVTTNKGRIKIGWRKRVINIDNILAIINLSSFFSSLFCFICL